MTDKYHILKEYFGYDEFRFGQEALIDAILQGRDAFGVMPTGAGKSICYQLPALLLPGITLVISPLIALMKDQVYALKQMGVAAAYINSSLTPAQQREALRRAALGLYKIIYVAPERLDVPEFIDFARNAEISLVAVDEAHCISQWGQDFRPSYLKISRFITLLPVRPCVAAFTATATQQVRTDVVRLLALQSPLCVTTGFDRPNLCFMVQKPKNKMAALMDFLQAHAGTNGIIYAATRKTVEALCAQLCMAGFSATRYHAGLSDEERRQNQEDFSFGHKSIMVATNAFGMGIDKSDVSFVVHYNMPKNIESYYQEAGRAGRDGSPADCLLLYSGADVYTQKAMIEKGGSNPELTQEEQQQVRIRDLDRLKRMTFYCTLNGCLRSFLLKYFGEQASDSCANCSFCLGLPYETEETGERLHTGKRARAAMPVYDNEDTALFGALKNLRSTLAAERHVPAYVIFSDATLHHMAAVHPRTEEEFLSVKGVGQEKQKQYGEAFLALLCDGELPPAPEKKKKEKKEKVKKERVVIAGQENRGKPWTKEDQENLKKLFSEGLTLPALAQEFKRTARGIYFQLKVFGMADGLEEPPVERTDTNE